MSLSASAIDAIRGLVDDLVAGNYAELEADGRIGRLTQGQLRDAIEEYGRKLVPLPDDRMEMHEYQSDADPLEFAVDVTLWTAEEGRSDLTLSLTVVENGDNPMLSIDDVHVL